MVCGAAGYAFTNGPPCPSSQVHPSSAPLPPLPRLLFPIAFPHPNNIPPSPAPAGRKVALFDLYDSTLLFNASAPLLGFRHVGNDPCYKIQVTRAAAGLAGAVGLIPKSITAPSLVAAPGQVPTIVALIETSAPTQICDDASTYIFLDPVSCYWGASSFSAVWRISAGSPDPCTAALLATAVVASECLCQ